MVIFVCRWTFFILPWQNTKLNLGAVPWAHWLFIYIYNCPTDYTNLETVRTSGLGLSSPILAITVSSVLEETGKGLEFPFLLSCKISGTGAANRLETTCP